MQASRVVLIEPRGFCAGVEMAVKALGWLVLRAGGRPVYCYHHVVHNEAVVERFRRLGVVFVDDLDAVPQGAPLLLSAHGSAPPIRSAPTVTVDAVCPLVAKVHHELRARAAAGNQILYVGHPGHDEAVGALAVAPEVTTLVPSATDLPDATGQPVALLAQTTLAVDEWESVVAAARRRYGEVWTAPRSDLCYATTNRQEAVRAAAPGCDAVVVVGSATSANTAALARVAGDVGVPLVLRVDGPSGLPAGVSVPTVAVTAGASAPESSVREVLDALGGTVERASVRAEHAYFPPPPALRRLLADEPLAQGLLDRDRSLPADELLSIVEAALAARAA
jgi:4-hydroxy-3-methylbut-2-en-1-yl diphosphate reductase